MHILFDIGKTKTRIAGSKDLTSFEEPIIFDTPKNYDEAIRLISEKARSIAKDQTIESVGGGIGGNLTPEKQALAEDVNFPGWKDKPICGDLWIALAAPAFLENDSAIVGLGEAIHGAGKNFGMTAYVTVSTSVGGARIIDGKIDKSSYGFEPGWQVLSLDGKYVADYLGGASVEKAMGKKPYEIFDTNFWDEKARILAYFLNNVIVMWSPEVVVVGGSMMKEIGIPIPATEKYLAEILKVFPKAAPIRKAELGDIGGLYGAMEFLKGKR